MGVVALKSISGTRVVEVLSAKVADRGLDFRTKLFDWIERFKFTEEEVEAELNLIHWLGARGVGKSEFRLIAFTLGENARLTEGEIREEVWRILHNRAQLQRRMEIADAQPC